MHKFTNTTMKRRINNIVWRKFEVDGGWVLLHLLSPFIVCKAQHIPYFNDPCKYAINQVKIATAKLSLSFLYFAVSVFKERKHWRRCRPLARISDFWHTLFCGHKVSSIQTRKRFRITINPVHLSMEIITCLLALFTVYMYPIRRATYHTVFGSSSCKSLVLI